MWRRAWHLTSSHQTHCSQLPSETTTRENKPRTSCWSQTSWSTWLLQKLLVFNMPPLYRTSEIKSLLWPQGVLCRTPWACGLLKLEIDFVGSVIFLTICRSETQALIFFFFSSATYYEHMGEGEKWEESILFADHFNLFILENSIQTHFPRKQHDTNYHQQQVWRALCSGTFHGLAERPASASKGTWTRIKIRIREFIHSYCDQ